MKIDVGLTMKRMLSVAIVVVLLSALGGCAHETEFRGPTGEGPVAPDGSIMIQSFYYAGNIYIPAGGKIYTSQIPLTKALIGEVASVDNSDWPDEELEGTNLKKGMEVYKSTETDGIMYVRIKKNEWYQFVKYVPEDATDIQSDVGLLANASPETSAMMVYYYDGSQTTVKMSFDLEKNKAIIEEINALGINQISPEKISEMKPPVYGIDISDKSGMRIWLTYSDGKWLSKDGSMYAGEYDLATVFEGAPEDNMTCIPGGSGMLNAALLGKYDIGYYALGEEISDSTGEISMEVLSISDNLVKLQLKNESKEEYLYGLPFTLEKEIDGRWYRLPVALSNWGFTLAASVLEPGGCAETYADLTMYGDLEAGKYRIVKEELAAEFEIR